MSTSNQEQAVTDYSELLDCDPAAMRSIFQLIRLLLEKAEPVSAATVASRLEMSLDEAKATLEELRSLGAEFDAEGRFVGFGLTLNPTPHRYRVKGQTFYTWCADDAIFFAVWFEHRAEIESRDPISDQAIRFTVTPADVEGVEPATAVISRRTCAAVFEDVRGTVCQFGHLFVSPETAAEYIAGHSGVGLTTGPVAEALEIAREMLERESMQSALAR